MFDFLKKSVQSFTTKVKESIGTHRKKTRETRELRAQVSVSTRIKKAVVGKTSIQEKDISGVLWELECALLEGDVEQETAHAIAKGLEKKLVGTMVSRGQDISELVKDSIRKTLTDVLEAPSIDIKKLVGEKKPLKILFLGPNGAGKTTSIAKVCWFFQNRGKSVILAAGDTFRAASIEQLAKHAQNLGVRLVKHGYGSDPAAVAFDAVKAAEAHNIDVVLIDSAGRQDTNKNLMNELKKIVRVVRPDLRVFVGESFAGQSLLQQAREFNEKVGVDGFIITKLDTDAKGGAVISLIHALKKPVIFVGTGQEYGDLAVFSKQVIISRVVG